MQDYLQLQNKLRKQLVNRWIEFNQVDGLSKQKGNNIKFTPTTALQGIMYEISKQLEEMENSLRTKFPNETPNQKLERNKMQINDKISKLMEQHKQATKTGILGKDETWEKLMKRFPELKSFVQKYGKVRANEAILDSMSKRLEDYDINVAKANLAKEYESSEFADIVEFLRNQQREIEKRTRQQKETEEGDKRLANAMEAFAIMENRNAEKRNRIQDKEQFKQLEDRRQMLNRRTKQEDKERDEIENEADEDNEDLFSPYNLVNDDEPYDELPSRRKNLPKKYGTHKRANSDGQFLYDRLDDPKDFRLSIQPSQNYNDDDIDEYDNGDVHGDDDDDDVSTQAAKKPVEKKKKRKNMSDKPVKLTQNEQKKYEDIVRQQKKQGYKIQPTWTTEKEKELQDKVDMAAELTRQEEKRFRQQMEQEIAELKEGLKTATNYSTKNRNKSKNAQLAKQDIRKEIERKERNLDEGFERFKTYQDVMDDVEENYQQLLLENKEKKAKARADKKARAAKANADDDDEPVNGYGRGKKHKQMNSRHVTFTQLPTGITNR